MEAEKWIIEMEKVFRVLECFDWWQLEMLMIGGCWKKKNMADFYLEKCRSDFIKKNDRF